MSYKDRAIRDYRPSENVEMRARRGMNDTAQRMAIRTGIAEAELRRLRNGYDDGQDYGTREIEEYLDSPQAYHPEREYSLDGMILRGKLANATGKGHIVEGEQRVQPIPGITDALYPDEIRLYDEPMDRASGALMEYNGGLEPFAGGGLVRRLGGALSTIRRDVPGKPSTVKIPDIGEVYADPIKEVEEAADNYMRKVGRPGAHKVDAYEDFDEERAARIAEAFERMKHDPADPEVRRAYDAMISETLDQYESLKDAGVDFRFLKEGQSDPYAKSPALGYADTIENGRLWVFPTDQGFGSLNEIADNPLLKRVGRVGDLENATANDAFRAVHDMYGHFGPGNPFFRHKGEERAWDNHSRMYSKDALPAMTTETRGQNSWLNFGPFGEQNRTALGADTVFADQKIGLLPSWAYGDRYATGGLVGGMAQVDEATDDLVDPVMFAGKAAREAWKRLGSSASSHLRSITPDMDPKVRNGIERSVWGRDGVGLNRDGQLMFEIDDSGARLKELPDFGPDPSQFPTREEYNAASTAWFQAGNRPPVGLKLQDVLDHPELYENYPDLAALPLRMNLLEKGRYGLMDVDPVYGKPGRLNYMQINRGLERGDMLDTILHEAQHGVQTLEGWTPGSNLTNASALHNRQNRMEEGLARVELLHGVINDPRLRNNPNFRLEALPALLGDKDLFKGLSPADWEKLFVHARTVTPEELAQSKAYLDQTRQMFDQPFSIYERNEGEVMARNTANRSELTAPERREAFWKDTEDRQGEVRFVGPEARPDW